MQQRRAGSVGRERIGDGRQRRIVDLDQFGRVARLLRRLRHDQGHRVADIAHAFGLEDGAAGIGHGGPAGPRHIHLAGQRRQAVGRRVMPGQHRQHARGRRRPRRFEAADAGVGVWAAQDDAMGLARQVDIVGEAARAGDEAHIFLAPHRLADAVLLHGWTFQRWRREGSRRFPENGQTLFTRRA